MTDQHYDQFSASVQGDWYLVEKEEKGELHPNLGKMGTVHLDKPKLRGSDYFGAMHLDNQSLFFFFFLGGGGGVVYYYFLLLLLFFPFLMFFFLFCFD